MPSGDSPIAHPYMHHTSARNCVMRNPAHANIMFNQGKDMDIHACVCSTLYTVTVFGEVDVVYTTTPIIGGTMF